MEFSTNVNFINFHSKTIYLHNSQVMPEITKIENERGWQQSPLKLCTPLTNIDKYLFPQTTLLKAKNMDKLT